MELVLYTLIGFLVGVAAATLTALIVVVKIMKAVAQTKNPL